MIRDTGGLIKAGALVVAGLVLAAMPVAALAHDGFTGVILEPDRVSPGGVIVVRGENVATDDELGVALIGGTGRVDLATVVTDGEGHFTVGVRIPTEVPVGVYAIEAAGPSGVRMTAVLFVEGAPIFDGQNGAPAGQDEGLPALPSAGSQAVPGPVAASRPVGGSDGDPATDVDLVPLAALVAAVGGLGLFVWWSRRPPAAPTGSADLP